MGLASGEGAELVVEGRGREWHSLAGDIPRLLVDHAGAVEAAAALAHLAARALEVGSAATLAGAAGHHLACAKVLAVA